MPKLVRFFLFFVLSAALSTTAADVQPTDIFTATTRVDTRDWSTEPLALIYPEAVLVGEDELWVTDFQGGIWHINTATGAKTLLGDKEGSGTVYTARHIIARLGENAIVVPVGQLSTVAEISHIVIDLQTGERRGFKNPDAGTNDLIGLPNGNLLAVSGGVLVIFDGNGQTLVKTDISPDPYVHGLARHPDGRIVGIAWTADLSSSTIVEIHPETAAVTPFATLPDIFPTRIAVGPDGTYYAVRREDDDDFTIYRIDGQTFAVSEIPLPPNDFRLGPQFDLDAASDGKVLIGVSDRRTRRTNQIGYPVILGIDPETFETEIVVGAWDGVLNEPGFNAMGQDNAIYFTGDRGSEHRVLRQDLKTGGVTVVSNNTVEGAVLDNTGAIAVDGDDIYVINNAGNPDWEQLVHVDRLTGAQTMLGSLGARLGVQQMMVDPADGSLLMAVLGFTAESYRSILRVVPQANPVFERVNPEPLPGNPMFFDIAPDGSLLVYVNTSEGSSLYRIERPSGAWSRLADHLLPPNYAGPVVVLDDGTIVARGFRDERTRIVLETIDPVTGVATEVIDSPPAATLLTRMPRGTGGGGGNRLSAATASQDFGDGWFQSSWYGWFNELDQWILHLEHGWQYYGGGSGSNFYLFDSILGTWLWISPDVFPLLYAFDPLDDWMIYSPGGVPELRWFFSFGGNAWVNSNDLEP